MVTFGSERRRKLICCLAVLTQIIFAEAAIAAPLGAIIHEFAAAGESFRLRSLEQREALLEAAAEATRLQLAAVPHAGLEGAEADLMQIARLARELEKTGEPTAYGLALTLRHLVDFAVLFELVRDDAVAAGKPADGPHVNGAAGAAVVERLLRASAVPGRNVLAFVMASPSSCARLLRKRGVSADDLWEEGARLLPREARDSAKRRLRCYHEEGRDEERDQSLLYDAIFWWVLAAIDAARDVRTVASVYAEGGWDGDYYVLEKRIDEILEEAPRLRLSQGWPDSGLRVLGVYGDVEDRGLADYEREVAGALRKALEMRALLGALEALP